MGIQLFVSLAVVILVLAVRGTAAANTVEDECRTSRCSSLYGPEIRFPFWVKDRGQPEYCGLPGFRVFCRDEETFLEFRYLANTSLHGIQLFFSGEAYVYNIDYTSREIELGYSLNLRGNLSLVSTSMWSPYVIVPGDFDDSYTFFSCSSRVEGESTIFDRTVVTSLGGQAFPLYYISDYKTTSDISIASCTKVFNSSHPFYYPLSWSTPDCWECEAKGEYCRLMNNITNSNIETADHRTKCLSTGTTGTTGTTNRHQGSIKPIAGIIPGATLLVLLLAALLYYMIRSYRQKKYDALKIEMFLTDYKAMKPTRYSYADIKKITSQFRDKLGQGGYGSVYKGQITNDIIVAVKVLNSDPKADGEEFINEVGTIGRIYHVNVVRLVGYCADGCYRALVYEFQPNSSLEKFTYSGKNHRKNSIGWEKMQEIAVGIAKGIEYLHEGCAHQILHFDIKPHNILLDQNFNPKISDFGLAKLCSKDQSMVSMTMARGTIGYIAPEVYSRNFGKVSSKSDVYSFGMLLLEMVGARENNTVETASETYFPEWIFHRLEEGGDVAIQIEKEEDSNIAKKLTIVGLWCIGWHPVDRPSMKHVISMLERQECPPMPPNPFKSSNVRPFANDLEVISETE